MPHLELSRKMMSYQRHLRIQSPRWTKSCGSATLRGQGLLGRILCWRSTRWMPLTWQHHSIVSSVGVVGRSPAPRNPQSLRARQIKMWRSNCWPSRSKTTSIHTSRTQRHLIRSIIRCCRFTRGVSMAGRMTIRLRPIRRHMAIHRPNCSRKSHTSKSPELKTFYFNK